MAHTRVSFLSSIVAFASIAILPFATAGSYLRTVIYTVAQTCSSFVSRAVDLVKSVVGKFEQPALHLVARPVELVQACAYALRLAKRERPHVRDTWRMCPSI